MDERLEKLLENETLNRYHNRYKNDDNAKEYLELLVKLTPYVDEESTVESCAKTLENYFGNKNLDMISKSLFKASEDFCYNDDDIKNIMDIYNDEEIFSFLDKYQNNKTLSKSVIDTVNITQDLNISMNVANVLEQYRDNVCLDQITEAVITDLYENGIKNRDSNSNKTPYTYEIFEDYEVMSLFKGSKDKDYLEKVVDIAVISYDTEITKEAESILASANDPSKAYDEIESALFETCPNYINKQETLDRLYDIDTKSYIKNNLDILKQDLKKELKESKNEKNRK